MRLGSSELLLPGSEAVMWVGSQHSTVYCVAVVFLGGYWLLIVFKVGEAEL